MEKAKSEIKKGSLTEDRRKFLKKMGGLAAMTTFGLSFFTSCGEDESPQPPRANIVDNNDDDDKDTGVTVSGNTITIDLDIVTELNSSGGWILILDAQTLVVNDGQIKALTSVCTHSNCDRNWSLTNGNFVCSCHGSVFTTNGAVVNGPANRPLNRFNVEVTDNIVTVTK
jgi:Rieske Fe-S protein